MKKTNYICTSYTNPLSLSGVSPYILLKFALLSLPFVL